TSHFSVDSGRIDPGEQIRERSFGDFAVLYRTKEQVQPLRDAFKASGIPFQVVGDETLEDATGIAELMSCLKIGWNMAGDLDAQRLVSLSAKGKCAGFLGVFKKQCRKKGHRLLDMLTRPGDAGLPERETLILENIRDWIQHYRNAIRGKTLSDQVRLATAHFGLADAFKEEESFQRGLKVLRSVAQGCGEDYIEFLSRVHLQQGQDLYDPRAERVTLMTMHASKGLEFAVVFVVGCEDGLIPYAAAAGDEHRLAEERRLFYVALTRAKEALFLTHVSNRMWRGKRTSRRISPFVEDVEKKLKTCEQPFQKQRRPERGHVQLSLFSKGSFEGNSRE
ncbi:MAG: ATP-dependent helicase, partial [Deltaproteobacteria bacterium]|nr:ATP-dependent helicase [Deltaproteobacteria bacterium]